jgi:hypothetical protein
MAKQDFARRRMESWHHHLDFYFAVYRWTITAHDKSAPQSYIPAIAHSRMLRAVDPLKDNWEYQPKTGASSSVNQRTIL